MRRIDGLAWGLAWAVSIGLLALAAPSAAEAPSADEIGALDEAGFEAWAEKASDEDLLAVEKAFGVNGKFAKLGTAAADKFRTLYDTLEDRSLPGFEQKHKRFFGLVQRTSKKQLIVDDRRGSKLKFEPGDDVQVVDLSGKGKRPKKTWRDVKKRDWVEVTWLYADNPRIAYVVVIRPDRREAGEFE